MNRRIFLKTTAISAVTSTLIPSSRNAFAASSMKTSADKKKIGLQLYSLRDDMGKSPDETIEAVAKMGFNFVEAGGYSKGLYFGKTPKVFSSQVSASGMKLTSTHTGFGVYDNDATEAWDAVKKSMEDVREAGCKWIVQAGYPGDRYTTNSQVQQLAEIFNKIGALAKQFGLKFAFHNHRVEFRAIQNSIPFQRYIELTDAALVSFQLDIGHAANEMADYLAYLRLYPGRFGCIHIVDTNVKTKEITELGKGNVRLEEVFNLFENAGVEDYYIEQERYNFTPLESVKMSYDYLANANFVKW